MKNLGDLTPRLQPPPQLVGIFDATGAIGPQQEYCRKIGIGIGRLKTGFGVVVIAIGGGSTGKCTITCWQDAGRIGRSGADETMRGELQVSAVSGSGTPAVNVQPDPKLSPTVFFAEHSGVNGLRQTRFSG